MSTDSVSLVNLQHRREDEGVWGIQMPAPPTMLQVQSYNNPGRALGTYAQIWNSGRDALGRWEHCTHAAGDSHTGTADGSITA